jgi:hypothetical protein
MAYTKPLAAVVAVLIATFSSFPYANGAGRSTTAVVNTILNGKGAPKSSLGIDGDYGPKTKGKWPTPQNIQGPTGPSGNDGKNGSDGKAISNANVNTVVGPQGPQGPTGPTGPQGEKGEAGLPGAMGPAGPAGSAGASGPAGANGSSGAQGATGATGATGPAGAKGETGTAGITKVIDGQLTFNDLSGGAGSGESVQVSGFESGKSYLVRIHIFTYQPNDSTEYFLPLSLSVTGTSTGVIAQSSYVLAHGYSYRSGSNRYENSIDAEIVLDGSSTNVAYGITILVASGRVTSGTELVKISGSFSAQEVQTTQIHA